MTSTSDALFWLHIVASEFQFPTKLPETSSCKAVCLVFLALHCGFGSRKRGHQLILAPFFSFKREIHLNNANKIN